MSAIDVMLPYYGDVDLMKAAATSVLNQTHQDFRLVVIDDGFPDPEPARWFGAMSDPRVVYTRNANNLGANANYRKAVDLVESDWFVMMGADDIMHDAYLATVAAAIARFDVDIVQPGVRVIDEHDNVVLPLVDRVKRKLAPHPPAGGIVLDGEGLAGSLLRGNWAYFPSLAWRTSTVKEIRFREGLDVVQDLALILDIIERGGRMAVLSEVVFDYRRHSQSDSSVRALDGRRFDEERRFFLGEAERFSSRGWSRAARIARQHWTSRLNAVSLVPRALTRGGSPRALIRHAVR